MSETAQAVYPSMRDRNDLLSWSDRRKTSSPLFSNLYRAIAEDDDLFALALESSEGQISARMLLSAVQFLLMTDPEAPLAAYFPTLTRDCLPPAGAVAPFKRFCLEHRDEIVEILRTRTLQTTSPRRAPQVMLALNEVAKSVGAPFSLVEIGCSAGLLLLFDHYLYEFEGGKELGSADAEVVLSSFEFIGPAPAVPASFPTIIRRVGLDLNPIDLSNPDERRWVLACTSADQVEKFEALRLAVDYRASMPLEVVTGNALATLPLLLDKIDGPVCILHSWCLYQWPAEAQAALSDLLQSRGRERTIHRIGIEASDGDLDRPTSVEVTHTIYRNGDSEARLIGRVSGNEERQTTIEWLA